MMLLNSQEDAIDFLCDYADALLRNCGQHNRALETFRRGKSALLSAMTVTI